jgi:glycosyltransferase involved in cell wall biosynthesis
VKVVFYLDRVMHYHIATFRELETRLGSEGGQFILLSGQKKERDKGRVPVANTVVRQHFSVPFFEWTCGSYTLRSQPKLPDLIRSLAPDVVIVQGHAGSMTYWRLGELATRMGFKYLTWQCGYEYNSSWLKHEMTRRFFKLFDHHLAYNTNAKKYLLNNHVKEARITVIHNTINEEEIDILPRYKARQIVIDELGLPLDRPIILYVGAILAEKRPDLLIEAVRRLPRGAASLIIVGDGPDLDSLKATTFDLDYIRYTGRVVGGVGRFFDAADIFVLPGLGGLAINEAMAHALPVISSFADGSADDLVIDQINGYVLRRSDADEIAIRLETLLRDPQARRRMGEVSRELITTKFSFKCFIDRVMNGLRSTSGDQTSSFVTRNSAVYKSNIDGMMDKSSI